MSQLYQRQANIQIGVAGSAAITSTGLRVRFQIQRSRTNAPDSGTITVFNMGPASRALLQVPGAFIRLMAGYQAPVQLFVGNPIKKGGIKDEQQGPDSTVVIEALDGGNTLRNTRVEVVFTSATTLQQVYLVVLAQLGIPPGSVTISSDIEFSSGFSYSGPVGPLLDRIAIMSGADWWISDESLYIVGEGLPEGTKAAVQFSSNAKNLIGSPTKRSDGRVEVRGLLSPTLRPGGLFTLQSMHVNGTYVAEDVKFVGDTGGWETPYYVETVGSPLAA